MCRSNFCWRYETSCREWRGIKKKFKIFILFWNWNKRKSLDGTFLIIINYCFYFICFKHFLNLISYKFCADSKAEMDDWIAFIRSVWDDVEQPSLEVLLFIFFLKKNININILKNEWKKGRITICNSWIIC